MSITQGRSVKLPRKNFRVTGEWNEQLASLLDEFLTTILSTIPHVRYGQYVGTGATLTVKFAPAIGVPLLVIMANQDTGAGDLSIVPVEGGPVTAWSKTSFTIDTTATVNTNGQTYQFLVFLQPTE